MESLWQVDYTSLLNEVCLRYLWPLIDEIGWFFSQKINLWRKCALIIAWKLSVACAPLQSRGRAQVIFFMQVHHNWTLRCTFQSAIYHQMYRQFWRWRIHDEKANVRGGHLHHHISMQELPTMFTTLVKGGTRDSPFQKRSPQNIQPWHTMQPTFRRLRMLPCLPTYSFSDFVWREKTW